MWNYLYFCTILLWNSIVSLSKGWFIFVICQTVPQKMYFVLNDVRETSSNVLAEWHKNIFGIFYGSVVIWNKSLKGNSLDSVIIISLKRHCHAILTSLWKAQRRLCINGSPRIIFYCLVLLPRKTMLLDWNWFSVFCCYRWRG